MLCAACARHEHAPITPVFLPAPPPPTVTPAIWPAEGPGLVVTSEYGEMRVDRMHKGIDIGMPCGTPVRAAACGKVVFAGALRGYGNTVILRHCEDIETLYAHLERWLVHAGEWVRQGAIIAHSGASGNATGPHLHYEVRVRGNPVEPRDYLPPARVAGMPAGPYGGP